MAPQSSITKTITINKSIVQDGKPMFKIKTWPQISSIADFNIQGEAHREQDPSGGDRAVGPDVADGSKGGKFRQRLTSQ